VAFTEDTALNFALTLIKSRVDTFAEETAVPLKLAGKIALPLAVKLVTPSNTALHCM